mgnify:CR=1 FL=1
MRNEHLLIRPLDKSETLANKIQVNVGSKSRRETVLGEVVKTCSHSEYPVGCTVSYPKYAADDTIINGVAYEDVMAEDIKWILEEE